VIFGTWVLLKNWYNGNNLKCAVYASYRDFQGSWLGKECSDFIKAIRRVVGVWTFNKSTFQRIHIFISICGSSISAHISFHG